MPVQKCPHCKRLAYMEGGVCEFCGSGGGTHVATKDDALEFMFVLYDIASVMAGGEEAALFAELSLGKQLFAKLVAADVLIEKTAQGENVWDLYEEVVKEGDGRGAHFRSRMMFSPTRGFARK